MGDGGRSKERREAAVLDETLTMDDGDTKGLTDAHGALSHTFNKHSSKWVSLPKPCRIWVKMLLFNYI